MIRSFALFCCFAFLFLKNGRYMQSNKIQEIFVIYAVVSYFHRQARWISSLL